MKHIKAGTIFLMLALFLAVSGGCGTQTQEEAAASDNSELRQQLQQYHDGVKAFQEECIAQTRAFSNSTQQNDTDAGQSAADALKKTLDHFDAIHVPEACMDIQPFFLAAKEKANTVYALMIQILGDRQYDNDDMPYRIALKDAVQMISDSCQSGFNQLNKAINALGQPI